MDDPDIIGSHTKKQLLAKMDGIIELAATKGNATVACTLYEVQNRYRDMPEIIRCKDCQHWKPPHVELTDGRQRSYKEDDKNDSFGIGVFGVSLDVGINIGGRCWFEYNRGYGRDMRVWRGENDFCSRAEKLPDGMTSEKWWGLSEEPSELIPD